LEGIWRFFVAKFRRIEECDIWANRNTALYSCIKTLISETTFVIMKPIVLLHANYWKVSDTARSKLSTLSDHPCRSKLKNERIGTAILRRWMKPVRNPFAAWDKHCRPLWVLLWQLHLLKCKTILQTKLDNDNGEVFTNWHWRFVDFFFLLEFFTVMKYI